MDPVSLHRPSPARRLRRALIGLATAATVLSGSSIAAACSQDNATYFESFLDTTCLQAPLANTTLDALGGLRLATNGALTSKLWDDDVHFAGEVTFPRVGVSTLATTGVGAPAALTLPITPLPLTPDPSGPVLGPTVGAVLDGDGVGGPSAIKLGAGSYVMYYTGNAEAGGPTVILRATSTDGKAWTRAATPNTAVLAPTPGSFDAQGVGSPEVRYDPADAATPYRMWYSGRGKVFGAIGYATSTDGITWTKYTGTASPADPPVAVLNHGVGGSGDSFSAADPSVIKDGLVWKMWYTGDDSNRKRINYATSLDGIVWQKGGTVLGPESANVTANFSEGAYAPVVWKSGATYSMYFSGRKFVSGTTYQTKIQTSTSTDGINWGSVGVGLNPGGNSGKFDFSNLEAPTVLDEGVDGAERYKLYYVGNSLDANGNGHDRIGLATSSNGASFSKFTGAQALTSVLDIGATGTAFDARGASGVAPSATTGSGANTYVGFYSGTRGSDFLTRLGEATSTDGASWAKVTGLAGAGGAIFDLGNGTAPDNKGALEPSALLDGSTYDLYYTGISSGGASSIALRTSPQDATTKQPTNVWSAAAAAVAGDGSGFDATGVSHASVIKDASTYVMHYTGLSSGVPEIGRITSAAASFTTPTRAASPVVAKGAAGAFDANGAKDPVVTKVGATDYRMIYTGIDADGVERLGYATSSDGAIWTKQGVILNPSRTGFAFDEVGLRPSGMLLDGAGTTLHVYFGGIDRTGRQRAGHATAAVPTATGGIPMGWATYQLGDSASAPRDFRAITRTSTATGVDLWLSFLQPYSGGTDFWSDYFPVTQLSPTETLNLLLTVKAIRWQARLSGPGGAPTLDKVQVDHAPVSFVTSGAAASLEVRPPVTLIATAFTNVVVTTSMFQPTGAGTGAGTVTVKDAATGAVIIPATALNTSGDTTVSLAGVNAAAISALRVELALTSGGVATPLVRSYTVGYSSAPAPPPDTTPPTGVLITGPSTLGKPFQLVKPLALKWTASDPESGILNYSLSYRTAPIGGGFGASTAFVTTTATGTTFAMKPGSTYCFRVRATNGKGLSADSPERCTALPLHAYGLTTKGSWAKKSTAGYYLGRYRTAKTTGAALLKTGVRVKRLAIIATRGKGMGTVTVYLGTTKLKTIKLAATTTRKRQVIAVATFTKVRKGTVKITVTSSARPVIIEGLAVSKV